MTLLLGNPHSTHNMENSFALNACMFWVEFMMGETAIVFPYAANAGIPHFHVIIQRNQAKLLSQFEKMYVGFKKMYVDGLQKTQFLNLSLFSTNSISAKIKTTARKLGKRST